jgi:hypothetical protein
MYLVFYGLAKVISSRGILKFVTNESMYQSFYKPKWFANFFESSSSEANLAYFNFLPDGKPSQEAYAFIKVMSDNFLDKIFTINRKHLGGKLARTDGFKMMKLISDVVALSFYVKIKLKRSYVTLDEWNGMGISFDDISKLKTINSTLGVMDRIFQFDNGKVSLINPCVSKQSRRLIELFIKISKRNNFDNEAGKYFENKYIPEYFKDTLNEGGERFQLHGKILSEQVIPNNPDGDIDLIVEDTLGKRFFFLQIKYLRNAGKPFLRGDVEYLTNQYIYKGIQQLSKMKKYHHDGLLQNILKEKGINYCSPENTTYMLVTNVTNIDFQKDRESGVVCYEWNTLRNLFLDGQCFYGHSNDMLNQKKWRYHSPLPLDEPSKVIDILMSESPALKNVKAENVFLSKYLKTTFKMDNVLCESIGLGM